MMANPPEKLRGGKGDIHLFLPPRLLRCILCAMPRTARAAVGGVVYHVLNRGNGRRRIFHAPGDYDAFVRVLVEGLAHAAVELLAFCLMSNHWHLVVRPRGDGDLAAYLAWVTNTHVKRYRARHRGTSGHLYQGRYKSFPVEADAHLLTLLRYVEANPRRARLAARAEAWRWSSLGCGDDVRAALLSEWPVERPRDWVRIVNRALGEPQARAIRTSIERDRPLGSEAWVKRTAARMGLTHTLRPRGRPRKPVPPPQQLGTT